MRAVAEEVAATAKYTKGTLEVVQGTGRSAGIIALGMLGKGLAVAGIGIGIYEMAHAKTTGERLMAGPTSSRAR